MMQLAARDCWIHQQVLFTSEIIVFLYFTFTIYTTNIEMLCLPFQSYGIKVGYGGIPGPSGGRDGSSSQAGGCCS